MARLLFCYDTPGIRDIFKRQCDELNRKAKCVERYSEAIKEAKISSYEAFFLDFQNNFEPLDVCCIADKIRELQQDSLLIGITFGYEKGFREKEHFKVVVNTADILNPVKIKPLEKFLKKHRL